MTKQSEVLKAWDIMADLDEKYEHFDKPVTKAMVDGALSQCREMVPFPIPPSSAREHEDDHLAVLMSQDNQLLSQLMFDDCLISASRKSDCQLHGVQCK